MGGGGSDGCWCQDEAEVIEETARRMEGTISSNTMLDPIE